MRDVLKHMESLPDVEIAETPDDLKVIAERTLQAGKKSFIMSAAWKC